MRGLWVATTMLAVSAGATLSGSAQAFERQWHLGAGLGGALLAGTDASLGPALGVHGAYGLSDVFDLKLDFITAPHSVAGERLWIHGVSAGLAYKIDVFEWVPYVGLGVGYYRLGPEPPSGLNRDEPGLSVDLGLDYALTRQFGLGAQMRYHAFLSDPLASLERAPWVSLLLRAEYRWGW